MPLSQYLLSNLSPESSRNQLEVQKSILLKVPVGATKKPPAFISDELNIVMALFCHFNCSTAFLSHSLSLSNTLSLSQTPLNIHTHSLSSFTFSFSQRGNGLSGAAAMTFAPTNFSRSPTSFIQS